MAERATVFQTTQIGVETTKGTIVPAVKRLLATGFSPKPVVPLIPFTPMGFKSPTAMVLQKEHTEADIKGVLSYNDICYLASSLFTAATISTPSGATNTRRWVFAPTATGPDSPVTFTVESGSVAGAERFPFGLVSDLDIRIGQTDAAVTGKLLGQALIEQITLTPGISEVDTVSLGSPSAGNFTLTVASQTTSNIAFNAAASAVQTALQALSSVGSGNALVTGAAGGPYTVTFAGALANQSVILTGNGAGLTGGTFAITRTTPGTAIVNITELPADPAAASVWVGNSLTNQVQTVGIGAASAGTFTLSGVHPLSGQTFTTAAIAFNASVGTFQTAMDNAVGPGNSLVGGAAPTWTVTFQNVFAGLTLSLMTMNSTGLTGATPSVTISTPAGLTQLVRVFEQDISVANRFTPEYTLDSTTTTFSNYVERSLELKAQTILMHDSVSAGLMADLRAKNEKFAKVIFWGPSIEAGFNYRIEIAFPFKFNNPTRGDKTDVWTGTYDMIPIYDSTFGGAIKITVDNQLTAL